MGLLEALTIVFIVLKLIGVIAWSWWLVLSPLLVAVGIYVLWFAFVALFMSSANRTFKKAKRKGNRKY